MMDTKARREEPIKRYDPFARYIGDGDYVGVMIEAEDGEFVLYETQAQVVAEKDKVIEGLRAYAQHKPECPANEWHYDEPNKVKLPVRKSCTCGMDELLSSIAPQP